MRNTLRLIRDDPDLTLQLIVGGTHLSAAHGMTVSEIVDDRFDIEARVPMRVGTSDDASLVEVMTECTAGLGGALLRLRPDILLLLGDRFELLPAAALATVLRVPIAHVCGGDVTEGAIDNQVRHALTKMAHLHLAGTEQAASRIIQMGEDPASVTVTGQPGLDEFVEAPCQSRQDLARTLDLDPTMLWVLFTYHPETMASEGIDVSRVRMALRVLSQKENFQIVLTASNADRGGDVLNAILREQADVMPQRFRFVASLNHSRFVAMMRQAHCVVGNSSAGIIEAASVPVPAINFGQRQRGRLAPPNVIQVEGDQASFEAALTRVAVASFRDGLRGLRNPYGDGNAAVRITHALKAFLAEPTIRKSFHAVAPFAQGVTTAP